MRSFMRNFDENCSEVVCHYRRNHAENSGERASKNEVQSHCNILRHWGGGHERLIEQTTITFTKKPVSDNNISTETMSDFKPVAFREIQD